MCENYALHILYERRCGLQRKRFRGFLDLVLNQGGIAQIGGLPYVLSATFILRVSSDGNQLVVNKVSS